MKLAKVLHQIDQNKEWLGNIRSLFPCLLGKQALKN